MIYLKQGYKLVKLEDIEDIYVGNEFKEECLTLYKGRGITWFDYETVEQAQKAFDKIIYVVNNMAQLGIGPSHYHVLDLSIEKLGE